MTIADKPNNASNIPQEEVDGIIQHNLINEVRADTAKIIKLENELIKLKEQQQLQADKRSAKDKKRNTIINNINITGFVVGSLSLMVGGIFSITNLSSLSKVSKKSLFGVAICGAGTALVVASGIVKCINNFTDKIENNEQNLTLGKN